MLRALAAVEVVLYHGRLVVPHPKAGIGAVVEDIYSGFSAYGPEAVVLFFVLSGFVIHKNLAQASLKGQAKFALSKYLRKRALRIYPPLTLAILLTFVLDLIGSNHNPWYYANALSEPTAGSPPETSIIAVVAAYTGLTGLVAGHFGSNAPLWSLAFEIVYYLAYIPIALLIVRLGGRAWPVFLVAAVLGMSFEARAILVNCTHSCRSQVPSWWVLWLAGAALAEGYVRLRERRRTPPRWHVILSIAFALMVVTFVSAQTISPLIANVQLQTTTHAYLIGLGFWLLILITLWPPRFMSTAIVRLRGFLLPITAASYSLYLVHMPVVHIVRAMAMPPDSKNLPTGWGLLLTFFVGVALFTTISYWLAERPITGGWRGSVVETGFKHLR